MLISSADIENLNANKLGELSEFKCIHNKSSHWESFVYTHWESSEMQNNVARYLISQLTDYVDNPAESCWSNWDTNGWADVVYLLTSHQALGTVHCDRPDSVLSQVLGNLKHKPDTGEASALALALAPGS